MKPLPEQMAVYAAYHRTSGNKMTHFIGVPLIIWGLMVLLAMPASWTISNLEITLAHIIVLVLLMYYLSLDTGFGIVSVMLFTVLLVTALEVVGTYEAPFAWKVGLGAFAAGWIFQLVGHAVWEKRRPALVDNLFQVFMAPLFLVAEVAFGLGMRKELRDEVEELAKAHMPDAAPAANS